MSSLESRLRRVEAMVVPEPEPITPVSEEHRRILEELELAGKRLLELADAVDHAHHPDVIAAARYCQDLERLERYLLDHEDPPDYLVERLAEHGFRVGETVL